MLYLVYFPYYVVILVFTILLFLFRNLRIALFIIFISILGIGGCVWALFLTGIPMNMGIIAENAILTVNQFLTTYQTTSDIDKSINFAISLSIRQKLMTAVGVKLALHH
jgi:cobalt-zinc-cadmium resistance protein CzcA